MMNLCRLYFVEIGRPEDYPRLAKIAKQYNGRYHSAIRNMVGSAFVFCKEADAKAFMEATKDWKQR